MRHVQGIFKVFRRANVKTTHVIHCGWCVACLGLLWSNAIAWSTAYKSAAFSDKYKDHERENLEEFRKITIDLAKKDLREPSMTALRILASTAFDDDKAKMKAFCEAYDEMIKQAKEN